MDILDQSPTVKDASLQLDQLLFRNARYVLKSIDHPLRQKIMRLIHRNREMNVTDIYKRLHLEQSVASQHLKWLRDARVVTTKRDGKQICYLLNYERLSKLNRIISGFVVRQ